MLIYPPKSKPKCMFYCQYIRGIGHLVRAVEIARHLSETFQVCLITGGELVNGFQFPESIEIVYLPGIKGDDLTTELKAVDFTLTIEDCKHIRTEKLLDTFKNFKPDLLVLEHFPFGQMFAFELVPLLDFIRAEQYSTKIVCSLRDIVLNPRGDTNDPIACSILNQYFDLLLIHSDPNFIKLSESFSQVEDIKCPIKYTGYVARKSQDNQHLNSIKQNQHDPQILVSIGGGRVGANLLESVIYASTFLYPEIKHKILMFTGPFMSEKQFINLKNLAGSLSHIEINRYTFNLSSLMYQSDISISMAGYNTIMDILVTQIPALLFIFDFQYQDSEQKIRAEKLEKLGIVDLIKTDELQSDILATKILKCLDRKGSQIKLNLNGARNTALLLREMFY